MKLKKKDRPGFLIVFEGIDGAGKSTQVRLLQDQLSVDNPLFVTDTALANTRPVVSTREPGGTPLGQSLRELMFNPDAGTKTMAPHVAQLTMLAAHVQHTHEVIVPALKEGAVILCDRYLFSGFAYDETPSQALNKLRREVIGPDPDLVIYLHGSVDLFKARATHPEGKKWDNLEALKTAQARYAEMFLELQADGRLLSVQADHDEPAALFERSIWPTVEYRLKKHFK